MLAGLFTATVFLSAALLFAVEPLVAKSVLPAMGGGAAVWTTCAAFFQLALLAGYLYAHLSSRWLEPRRQAVVHLSLLAAAGLGAALRAPAGWAPPARGEALWLLARLGALVGAPFVLLSATAPLAQRWFATTRHPQARDPYFLYAASNVGSLAALLAYPFWIEPSLGLAAQRRAWNAGVWLEAGLLALCAVRLARRGEGSAIDLPAAEPGGARPAARQRAGWLLLSAVPSSLMLSVTSHLTTDLVAVPLLWVAPLALYLLTFVLAFSRRAWIPLRWALRLQPLALVPTLVAMGLVPSGAWQLMPVHLVAFFATALVCHEVLAARRPPARWLTEYYLWISVGGAAGGLFNVLVAPCAFPTTLEYPLGLVAAVLLRPRGEAEERGGRWSAWLDLLLPGALLAALGATAFPWPGSGAWRGPASFAAVLVAGVVVYGFAPRPLRFALGVAVLAAAGPLRAQASQATLWRARSFYGVHAVYEEGQQHRLRQGNTLHGAQDRSRPGEPITYYARTGPVGQVLEAWRGRPERRRVGVVGLGAGTLAAYGAPGERWTFFEIDPEIVRIAREPRLFTYLAASAAEVEIRLGDARRGLERQPPTSLGILVLDAFSSDAIPVHLLTREAFELYARALEPHGVIAVHLSNRYLDLVPVVAATATGTGLEARVRTDRATPLELEQGKNASTWMLLARAEQDLAPLGSDPRWEVARSARRPWTDDASDVWSCVDLGRARARAEERRAREVTARAPGP